MTEMTVDELAARAGMTVRTVRFYAGRGLLPPPRLRGRTGLYDADHLARLELVRELQSLGLTLSAIERHLQRIPPDATPEDLALQRSLLSPWAPEQAEDLDRHELDRRAGRHLDDEALTRLEALGVIERLPSADLDVRGVTTPAETPLTSRSASDGERTVRVISPALLGAAAELASLPMPIEALKASHDAVERHTTALAEELQRAFQDAVVRPYRERGRLPEERERLLELAGRLKPLMIQSLVTSFQRAVDRAIRRSVPDE